MTGSSKSQNGQMVAEQQRQAQEARDKETARQGRLDTGLAGIRAAFEGGPIKARRSVDQKWQGGAAPAGFTASRVAKPGAAGATGGGAMGSGANININGGYGDPTGRWVGSGEDGHWENGTMSASSGSNLAGNDYEDVITGADGKIYRVGDTYGTGTEEYDTGQTSGGFGDDFYNKYKQGILDYYTPQVDEQYNDAKKELTYRLARAGTSRSGTAADETAKLSKQYDLNTSQVRSKADAGAADLRNRVASERTKAESQLYATENPDVAVNQALGSVRNISLDQPELSPLAEIFKVGSIGGAGLTKGYNNGKATQVAGGTGSSGGGLINDAWRYVTG